MSHCSAAGRQSRKVGSSSSSLSNDMVTSIGWPLCCRTRIVAPGTASSRASRAVSSSCFPPSQFCDSSIRKDAAGGPDRSHMRVVPAVRVAPALTGRAEVAIGDRKAAAGPAAETTARNMQSKPRTRIVHARAQRPGSFVTWKVATLRLQFFPSNQSVEFVTCRFPRPTLALRPVAHHERRHVPGLW